VAFKGHITYFLLTKIKLSCGSSSYGGINGSPKSMIGSVLIILKEEALFYFMSSCRQSLNLGHFKTWGTNLILSVPVSVVSVLVSCTIRVILQHISTCLCVCVCDQYPQSSNCKKCAFIEDHWHMGNGLPWTILHSLVWLLSLHHIHHFHSLINQPSFLRKI